MKEIDIEKALLMVLFPFFTVILLVGFVVYHTRGGRPIRLTLKGLGISFELNSIDDPAKPRENTIKETQCKSC